MTKTQEIPDEIWEVANKICRVWDDPALTIEVAEAIHARDTAARKECAEIARRYPERDPAEDGNGYWAAEEIATAVEATIGGAK